MNDVLDRLAYTEESLFKRLIELGGENLGKVEQEAVKLVAHRIFNTLTHPTLTDSGKRRSVDEAFIDISGFMDMFPQLRVFEGQVRGELEELMVMGLEPSPTTS